MAIVKRPRRYVETPEYRQMLSRTLRTYRHRVGRDLAELPAMAEFVAEVNATLTATVHDLRSSAGGSHSWAQIGTALGITPQAAQQRFRGAGARTTGGQPSNLR